MQSFPLARQAWMLFAKATSTFLAILLAISPHGPVAHADDIQELRVMSWNIWHGGREDSATDGPRRVTDVIRTSCADVVAMQETYGSGEQIAHDLRFHFHGRGTNVSIHSRYPVVEDISVGDEFNCVGGLIQLSDDRRVAFYSIWLPYDKEIWAAGTRPTNRQAIESACESSAIVLRKLKAAIEQRLDRPRFQDVPVIIAGDFNSMSHSDYTLVHADQFGLEINWKTSQVLARSGFRDAYREVHPDVDRQRDRTWTPRFKDQQQDRIDFIYYKSQRLRASEATVIDQHPEKFPSDHAAVLATLQFHNPPPRESSIRHVVSYNIKHGRGMDGEVNLARTAAVLEDLSPDIVGLQEVDQWADRSGRQNTMARLSEHLAMHPAFGSFMDFQGGKYGLGILSKHPILSARAIRLPTGNEPRVALAVEVHLPDGSLLMVVNVHFDWVSDDAFRFAQAQAVRDFLDQTSMPFILLGDFNDTPDSRTVGLFSQRERNATKPQQDPFTFSSTEPRMEIDYIFAAPKGAWQVNRTQVVDEPVASDHRPVFAELEYDSD